ncbi:MAG: 16S rRNA (guanine(966)-N(2))-methyltransferase RsmD [Oscillospiraceae bacterium]|nr:16S rRNA (guanine(966)-N(2))-methyltransferase RsmD [Oscillospiraceae bacterium]
MRVITGIARGRKLKEPKDYNVRPTTDMVKESIFNIIQFDLEGRRVLDLFSGSGQMGIEALSRGAAFCDFVDSARDSFKLTQENLTSTGLGDKGKVHFTDAAAFLNSVSTKYGVVFIDPPYDTNLLEKTLKIINQIDILERNGIIICESRAEKEVPDMVEPYYLKKSYKYGKIKITVYARN